MRPDRRLIHVERAVDLDLDRVLLLGRAAMGAKHIGPREGGVLADAEPGRRRFGRDPPAEGAAGGMAVAVAQHQFRRGAGQVAQRRVGHRMDVDQDRLPEAAARLVHQGLERAVIGAPGVVDPAHRLGPGQRAVADLAPVPDDAGDDPQPRQDPRAGAAAGPAFDRAGVQLVGAAVQVHQRARDPRGQHDRPVPGRGRDQPVHERILGRAQLERGQARFGQEPVGVIPPRMGRGEDDAAGPAVRPGKVEEGRKIALHEGRSVARRQQLQASRADRKAHLQGVETADIDTRTRRFGGAGPGITWHGRLAQR